MCVCVCLTGMRCGTAIRKTCAWAPNLRKDNCYGTTSYEERKGAVSSKSTR